MKVFFNSATVLLSITFNRSIEAHIVIIPARRMSLYDMMGVSGCEIGVSVYVMGVSVCLMGVSGCICMCPSVSVHACMCTCMHVAMGVYVCGCGY